uniref:Protein ZIP4 homolog n=1 Tax=Strigamia maritima TaxID=126957 RepID=T1J0K8_STRMM
MASLLSENSDEIRSLIKEALYLSKDDNLQITLFKLRNICEDFFASTTGTAVFEKCQLNLEKESLVLWNLVAVNCEKYSKECIAAVNYIASRILRQMTNSIRDLSVEKKMILMKITTRTCRSLLDCDQVDRAQVILCDSSLIFDSLSDFDLDGSRSVMIAKFKFFNEMCRTEICVRRGKDEEGFVHVEKTKCLLGCLDKDFRVYLINFCYNLGLEFYYDKLYEKSTVWLRNALQVDKHGESDKILKLKIILCTNQHEHNILTTFHEWIKSKPTDSGAYKIIQFLIKYDRFPIAFDVLNQLETTLSRQNETGKFVHYFLAKLQTESHFEHAQRILAQFQGGNYILSCEMASAIGDFCLEKGQEFHKKFDYLRAIEWYNLSEYISTFVTDDRSNVLRTLQCKCICFIHVQDVDK